MNQIEQIWKELRARGFHNEVFQTLEKVVDRLCDTINDLTKETIRSITGRDWVIGCFNYGIVLSIRQRQYLKRIIDSYLSAISVEE